MLHLGLGALFKDVVEHILLGSVPNDRWHPHEQICALSSQMERKNALSFSFTVSTILFLKVFEHVRKELIYRKALIVVLAYSFR